MFPSILDGYGPSYNLGSCYSRQEVGKEKPLSLLQSWPLEVQLSWAIWVSY